MRSKSSTLGGRGSAFGLVGWLEQTRVVLPLKGVESRFAVHGELLSVELDQIFHQPGTKPIDCLYSFPLPADAAIYRCEMHVNGRIIAARVEERGRAIQLAREKKAAGYRTTLIEAERDNLFTLSLGNVQPGDLVVVRLAYFQVLSHLGDWTSFHIPVCPGVRYIPGQPLLRSLRGQGVADDTDQVPDASRISPPRIDRLHPDAAYFCVEGMVESFEGSVKDLSSPSHPVLVREEPGRLLLTLADEDAVPDQNFVARWTTVAPPSVAVHAWRTRAEDGTYLLLRLAAPEAGPGEEEPAQDYYFLLDRSGSMQGMNWRKTVQAFHDFLRHLRPADRAWATLFNNHTADVAEAPLPAAELLADPAVMRLEGLEASGGTELLPALEHVLDKVAKHSKQTSASLIIITDGQVGNEHSILQRARRIERLVIHTFGIDTAVNDGLLRNLAEQSGGACVLLHPADDISGAVARSVGRLRRPILTAIEVGPQWEPADERQLQLHAGETRTVTFKTGADDAALRVNALSSDAQTRTFDVAASEAPAAVTPLLWMKTRIAHQLRKGDTSAAILLAKQANLLCDGVAFVAWDETEKVPVATQELYQPALRAVLGTDMLACRCDTSFQRAGDASDIADPPDHRRGLLPGFGAIGNAAPRADGEGLTRLIAAVELCEARDLPMLKSAIQARLDSATDRVQRRKSDRQGQHLFTSLEALRQGMQEVAAIHARTILDFVAAGSAPPARIQALLNLIPGKLLHEVLTLAGAGTAGTSDLSQLAEALERIATLRDQCWGEVRGFLDGFLPSTLQPRNAHRVPS